MASMVGSRRVVKGKRRIKCGSGPFRENDSRCLYNLQRIVTVRLRCWRCYSMWTRRSVSLALIAFLTAVSVIPIPPAESADREINVAAAADLTSALQEVAANYEKRTGVVVKLSFGASGALTQQIQNGAPFDVFFSADMDYPRQLIAGGQAEEATLYRYAIGRLV